LMHGLLNKSTPWSGVAGVGNGPTTWFDVLGAAIDALEPLQAVWRDAAHNKTALLGAARYRAQELRRSRGDEDIVHKRDPATPSPGLNAVLLIVHGLLRYHREGWAQLQRQVISVNPSFVFDVALLTSSSLVCSEKDYLVGACACAEDLPALGQRGVSAQFESMIAPHRLVFAQFSQFGGKHFEKPTAFYRLARGWLTMQDWGIAQVYARVLAIRPDAAFTAPLHLDVACRDHPGLSVLSGTLQRSMNFHDHDIDERAQGRA